MAYVGGLEALRLERRAGKIDDPLERLRFLRQAMRGCVEGAAPARTARRRLEPLVPAAVLLLAFAGATSDARRPALPAFVNPGTAPEALPEVWLVERTPDGELYSNGLRVEISLEVSTRPRLYRLRPRPDAPPGARPWRRRPAGIVLHASEGELADFVPARTGWIERQSLGLLAYAHRHRLYHYVVDRFGRVHRIVVESDVADHAGHSLWADADGVYLNLNASFLGVAFEARSAGAPEPPLLTPAQVHAGRVLTQLLRAKHRLPPENCLTHAQVSVNPFNSQIGFHSDWARQFPFAELGLPDNYLQPPPGVWLFGFDYEPAFFAAAAPSLRIALLRAGEQVRQDAAQRDLKPVGWRASLQRKYRQAAAEAATERTALEALARLEVQQP